MTVNVAEGVKVQEAVPATYPAESEEATRVAGLCVVQLRSVPVELMKLTVPVGGLPELPPEGFVEKAVSINAVSVTECPDTIVVPLEGDMICVVVGAAATEKLGAGVDGVVIAL